MVVHMRLSNVQTRGLKLCNVSRCICIFQKYYWIKHQKIPAKAMNIIIHILLIWRQGDKKVEAPKSSHRVKPRELQWAIRIPGSELQSNLLGHYTAPSSHTLKYQMTVWLLCWLSCPLFPGDELVVLLSCQSNHSGWGSIWVFNPHSLASSLALFQKITAFSLNDVGTDSCPHLPSLNFCFCGGVWRVLIHQLLCYMHVGKHKTRDLSCFTTCSDDSLKRCARSNWYSNYLVLLQDWAES